MLQMSLRVVAGRRCSRCTAVVCRQERLRRSARPSSAIDPIDALFADVPALAPHQQMEASVAEWDARLRELAQPLPQGGQRIPMACVPEAQRQKRVARQARRSLTAYRPVR